VKPARKRFGLEWSGPSRSEDSDFPGRFENDRLRPFRTGDLARAGVFARSRVLNLTSRTRFPISCGLIVAH
jgi:hypothetical protein